jgi:hypothetical protein
MRTTLTGALSLLACALGACGGNDSTGSKDEQAVRAVVKEGMTTTDPDACARLLTRTFLEQTTLETGVAAIRSCRKDAGTAASTSLSIDRVTVSGARAAADIRPKGGSLPFKTATLGLRKMAGSWKIDRLKGGTLDRAALARVMHDQLTAPPDALPVKTVDCAVQDLRNTADSEIIRAYVKPAPRVLVIPVAVCTVRRELADSGAPRNVVACIEEGIRRELTTGALGRKLEHDPSSLALLQSADGERLGARVARACVRSLNVTKG